MIRAAIIASYPGQSAIQPEPEPEPEPVVGIDPCDIIRTALALSRQNEADIQATIQAAAIALGSSRQLSTILEEVLRDCEASR